MHARLEVLLQIQDLKAQRRELEDGGGFVSVPTAVASDPAERKGLRACDHCGRFLYFVR